MVGLTVAEPIPKPQVPQFSLRYVDKSYDIPPQTTTTIDPYNGETITSTTPGRHVENYLIEMTIKNQPHASSLGNNTLTLYYFTRFKGHFAENWTYPNTSFSDWAAYYDPSYTGDKSMWGNYADDLPVQSNTGNTVLTFPANYRVGDKIDFQIEALLAYQYTETTYDGFYPVSDNIFYYNPSGWSDTETITITSTPEPANNTNPAPSVPELPFVAFFSLFAMISLIAFFAKKRIYLKPYN
ncbi:MAG: hypothetical protein NWE93_04580 [Candidatus Bathyarchaeota archaeon]|nr:hypothetical protein [Candidatus Bathyarchaeota archaeon]